MHARRTHIRSALRIALSLPLALGFSWLAIAAAPTPAYAYVDPSVMTYTIQALAGVAVALGAVAGVAFRRTRKWIFKAFGIDENANKEVEGDVVLRDDADFDAAVLASEASASAHAGGTDERFRDVPLKARIAFAAIAAFFFAFTVFFVAPMETIAGNAASFTFGIGETWQPVAVLALIVFAALALVLSVLRGRAFALGFTVVAVAGIALYIQAMFLNPGLPVADGAPLYLGNYKTVTAWTSLVLLVVCGALFWWAHKSPRTSRLALSALALALVFVQGIGLAVLIGETNETAGQEQGPMNHVTEQGLYSLSEKSNVVVFILDTYDTYYLDRTLENYPGILDGFTDFTYFHNATGIMNPTRFAVPYLLTNRSIGDYGTFEEYSASRFTDSTFLSDIQEAGYSIGVYADDLREGEDLIASKTINIHPVGQSNMSFIGVMAAAAQIACYRDLPWILKQPFWYSTDQVNEKMTDRATTAEQDDTVYVMNDGLFNERLQERGLALDDTAKTGAFRFIHMLGAHEPFAIDEWGERSGDTDPDRQYAGSLRIVENYLEQMKELGVYDQSTIIITADHGWWDLVMSIDEPSNPILLVKPAYEPGTAPGAAYSTSEAPTGHLDFTATVIDAIGGDASPYGSTVWEAREGDDRTRFVYWSTSDRVYYCDMVEYAVEGPATDWDSWRETGRIWNVDLKRD